MKSTEVFSNNWALVAGKIVSEFRFSHEESGEKYYIAELQTDKTGDATGIIPLMVPEWHINDRESYIGEYAKAEGYLHTYHEEKRSSVSFLATESDLCLRKKRIQYENRIYLEGYICKKPVYATEPQGQDRADVLLAVNCEHGRSEYISCVCFGEAAKKTNLMEISSRVIVWGKFHSREYQKKLKNGESISRMAYEVYVNKIEEFGLLIAAMSKKYTGLPYDIWVYEPGWDKSRYPYPKLTVSNGDHEVAISICDDPQPFRGEEDADKLEQLHEVQKFVKEQAFAFLLHWNGIWDSVALFNYCLYIGRKRMSKEDALQKLLDDGLIDEIPKSIMIINKG